MSTIYAQASTDNSMWDFAIENLNTNYCDIKIFFTESSNLENINFGYSIKINEIEKYSESFTSQYAIKESNINELSSSGRITFNPDDNLNINFWYESNSIIVSENIDLQVPRPQQPFLSWTWENKKWNPPIDHPLDGKMYKWDDEKGWIEVEMDSSGIKWNIV